MTSRPSAQWLRPSVFWGLVLYAIFGALWILTSDSALSALGLSPDAAARMATGKGLLFVLISAIWAVFLLRIAASAPADAGAATPPAETTPGLAGWMLAIALLVPLIGAGVYTLQLRKLEADTARSLLAIAEIGSHQLSRVLHERHVDAAVFAMDETQLSALRANAPVDAESAPGRQLVLLADGYGYSSIEVLDHAGNRVLAHGTPPTLPCLEDEPNRQLLLQTLAVTGTVSLPVRSYVCRSANALLLKVVVELIEADRTLGRVEFWQPMTELLAGLGSQGSRVFPSEETVLGRRSGDQLVFVARRWTESASEARLQHVPVSSGLLIGGALSAGGTGQIEGIDFRGNAVLAGHAAVAGSDWQLLVKVDRGDLRNSLLPLVGWIIAVLMLYLGLLAISLIALWSRHRQVEALRTLAQSTALDRLMQQFFNLPFVGIAFTSPTSKRWLRFNDRLCEILGYSRAELEALTWAEITHPEDLQPNLDEFDRAMQGESDDYALQKRFIRKDGGVVHAYIDVHCLRREDASAEVFITTIDDITEEVLARQALLESHHRLQQVVVESPHPTMVLAEDGEIRLLSRSWCELSGYRAEQLGNIDDWLRLVRPAAERAPLRAHIQALFEAAGSIDEGDFPVRCSDGKQLVWNIRSMPLGPGPDGRREIVTSAVDVTAQRLAVAELLASEQLYRQVFDDNPICMYVFDAASLQILQVNNAMESTYGWTREQLLAMRIDQLQPDADVTSLHLALAGLHRDRLNRPGVFTHRRRDGSTLRAEIAVHATNYQSRDAWLALAVDVTERDHYISKLEHAASSTLSVVSTMVELRDPYTAGHERRVGRIAADIAAEMGLDKQMQQGLLMCGEVHDVGKVAVPAEILSKPARLSPAEYDIVKQHAQQGYEILKAIELPWPLAEVARQHHERMDGSGYPRGLKGEEILLEARIIAVADVVESMASHRPYRPAMGPSLALAEIEANSGRLYDPAVAAACLRLFREKGYSIPA